MPASQGTFALSAPLVEAFLGALLKCSRNGFDIHNIWPIGILKSRKVDFGAKVSYNFVDVVEFNYNLSEI
jgi:hypothetical protein